MFKYILILALLSKISLVLFLNKKQPMVAGWKHPKRLWAICSVLWVPYHHVLAEVGRMKMWEVIV